ncbi:MAG: hypothetical protein R6V84_10725, partial [Desulfobacterales bacterium]
MAISMPISERRCSRPKTPMTFFLEEADDKRINAMRKNCETLINEKFTKYNSDRLFLCGAGNDSFNVGYDGRFRLCSSLCADCTTYDLKNGTLAEAWFDFVPKVCEMR